MTGPAHGIHLSLTQAQSVPRAGPAQAQPVSTDDMVRLFLTHAESVVTPLSIPLRPLEMPSERFMQRDAGPVEGGLGGS